MSNSSVEKDQGMLIEMKKTMMKKKNSEDYTLFSYLRRMRDIRRLSGFHLTRAYSVAEHCYYTGMLFMMFANQLKIAYTEEGVFWVFSHDLLETATGDLLYPAKNLTAATKEAWRTIEKEIEDRFSKLADFSDENGEKALGQEAYRLFKTCDALELYLFCIEERERGNVLRNIDGSKVSDVMYRVIERSGFKTILDWIETW